MKPAEHLVVWTTVGSEEEADSIATALVDERLAACVNITPPVRSVYHWQGEVQKDEERLLVIKTTAQRFAALRDRIRQLHSYDLPEIIALPIEAGLAGYLDWISERCATG